MAKAKIRVKVISRLRLDSAQFFKLPQAYPQVTFTLDPDARDYDWLAIYDDLPPAGGERHTMREELLPRNPAQSLLLTFEPAYLKHYGRAYTDQFGVVLTSQPPALLPHPNRYDAPPVGCWFYGSYEDAMRHRTPPKKTNSLSVFGSNKTVGHTLHALRYRFLQSLTAQFGDALDVFGKPHRPVAKKLTALDSYKYHIAVENYVGAHHWTEKLSDSFLGYSLPFYAGCPNAADYVPAESFIPLDMRDPDGAVEIIRAAIANNEYEKRLSAISEARRLMLEEYNLGNVIARAVVAHHPDTRHVAHGGLIRSRNKIIRASPRDFWVFLRDKARMRRDGRRKWRNYIKG